jgi:hypothetical protein
MSDFTGQKIANTYKNLLQVSVANSALDSTLKSVETGAGNVTPLQISTDKVNIGGTFQIGGVALTANVTALNNIADLSSLTGVVVGDSGTLSGRTITGTSPISISNGNGVSGNPTISLATTGITSATYGPLGKFNIDTFGRVISVSVATTVSANAFVGGTLNGSSLTVENDTSIGGDVVIEGTTNMKAVSATDVTLNNLTLINSNLNVGTVSATTVNTSILNATTASITDLTAGTLSFTDASVANFNSTNLFAVSANATRLFQDGVAVPSGADIAAVSVLTKTNLDAITSINTVVTSVNSLAVAVSALTKTNLDAITSINTVVANVSALTKTNLDAVTSINTVVAGVSALTKTNLDAITSINTVVTSVNSLAVAVSALTKTNLDSVTSINTVITNLSSTMATSINNRTDSITSVNSYITALSATFAASIANSGGGGTTINNNANNRFITGSDTADTLEGESTLTYDGSGTIAKASGDLTLDVGGDIILDADGDQIRFKADGTLFGLIGNESSDFLLQSSIQDKDIVFQGNDGGSGITALTLDMSEAGAATFNNDVTAFSDKRLKTDIEPILNALEKVMRMQGVYYKRNDVENAKTQVGVLAQDMENILPEVVITADDKMQTKSVDYGKLTSVLIEAIKQLSNEVTHLKQQIINGG